MKILVTGSKGQLGRELHDVLEERCPGKTVYVDINELDITDADAVGEFLREGDFSHIINCAAYTDVEHAEEEEHKCYAINVDGIRNLARHADPMGAKLLHVSTDYVFDGNSCRPYTEGDKPNPTSAYGNTKRRSEIALMGLSPESIIVRTGWLYSPHGRNFVKTMLRVARERADVKVVFDQIGTPTYARHLAEAIAIMVLNPRWMPGIYHYSNEGACSWYDFAIAIFETAGIDCRVTPITSDDFPSTVTRPHFSVLDKSRIKATYNLQIPHWQQGLRQCIARLKNDQ